MQQHQQQMHPRIQQHIADLLQQQTTIHQQEIANLRSQGSNFSPEQNTQLQHLYLELQQQKLLNDTLQEKIKVSKSDPNDNNIRLNNIEEKKKEIIGQMTKLKETMVETQHIIDIQNKNIERIDTKMTEIKSIIVNNIDAYNNIEKNEIINTRSCVKNANKYVHSFDKPINMLTNIGINSYSFPKSLHNINTYNNTLYIISDYSGEIICDTYTSYIRNNNMHVIKIISGNYTIEKIIEYFNKILSQLDIVMDINTSNDQCSFTSTQPFTLVTEYVTNKYNILNILGFDDNVKMENKMTYNATSAYDLRSDNIISLYITNLSSSVPFCKFNIANSKMYNRILKMSTSINDVTKFNLEFRDSNNNPISFGNKNVMLDFTLKSIETMIPTLDVKEYKTPFDEKDLHNQITEMMNIT